MATPKLKLTYWDMEGLAEPIRLSLVLGGIDFEDNRISREAWAALKVSGKCPFSQLPILEVDNQVLSQSQAMLRYVGKLTKLYPDDFLAAARVDEYLGFVGDIASKIVPTMYEKDEAKKMEMRKNLQDKVFPEWYQLLEQKLKAVGTGYCVGDKLTIADLNISTQIKWITSGILDGISKTVLDPFPSVLKVRELVESKPEVQAYRKRLAEA